MGAVNFAGTMALICRIVKVKILAVAQADHAIKDGFKGIFRRFYLLPSHFFMNQPRGVKQRIRMIRFGEHIFPLLGSFYNEVKSPTEFLVLHNKRFGCVVLLYFSGCQFL